MNKVRQRKPLETYQVQGLLLILFAPSIFAPISFLFSPGSKSWLGSFALIILLCFYFTKIREYAKEYDTGVLGMVLLTLGSFFKEVVASNGLWISVAVSFLSIVISRKIFVSLNAVEWNRS